MKRKWIENDSDFSYRVLRTVNLIGLALGLIVFIIELSHTRQIQHWNPVNCFKTRNSKNEQMVSIVTSEDECIRGNGEHVHFGLDQLSANVSRHLTISVRNLRNMLKPSSGFVQANCPICKWISLILPSMRAIAHPGLKLFSLYSRHALQSLATDL